ncbi:PhzF family phenazine biosynthesis protein [Longispora sp. NPDC051575]|uniref:PhzF family phenazine biosynthesis protein n=1 Tax=Longispora sp. NPDC051575 TaxID=3154943 RepID=UPI0034447EB8
MKILVVRAFTGDGGAYGNGVRVVLASGALPDAATRQAFAGAAVEPASVFVAPDLRTVRIHNRTVERRFIGHGLLGAAAALCSLGHDPRTFTVPAGDVRLWLDGDGTHWLHAPSEWSPNDRHRQLATAGEVAALTGPPPDEPVQVWAWSDEAAGLVRARQFKPSLGIPEDEACGSASMVLARALGRDLTVLHGRGSRIHVRPRDQGVDLGGTCVVDAVLESAALPGDS